MEASASPVLIVGAGAMGGALIAGWLHSGALAATELIVRDPAPGARALAAQSSGAALNTGDADLARARSVVLAVKPQLWRAAVQTIAPHIAPGVIVVSIVAGVTAGSIGEAFMGHKVARVMPTTAAAIGRGTASVFAADAAARRRAHDLFEPLGDVVDLDDEDLMHAATALSGSGPAYFYAFAEALEAAGAAAGLPASIAERMARSTLTGAAALLASSGEPPSQLRAAVTSPGGTTQAALTVLGGNEGLGPLMQRAVAAGAARSRQLAP